MKIKDIEEYFNKYGEKAYFTFKSEYHYNYISTCLMHKSNNGKLYGYDKISGDLVPVNESTIDRILMLDHYNKEVSHANK